MRINRRLIAFIVFSFFLLVNMFAFSFAGDIMTIQADILDEDDSEIISVEVPDLIFLGEVSKGKISDEFKVYINNTGNVDIKVTPRIVSGENDIFSYLSFRKTKTRTINGTSSDVPYTKIDDFSFNITKPLSGKDYNDEYFYLALDLREYPSSINQDKIGLRTDVKFFAVKNN